MNRNDKIAAMFLADRDKKRDFVAKKSGKDKKDCIFQSYPMDKRIRSKH